MNELKKKGITFTKSYKIFKKFCTGAKIFSNGTDNLIMKTNLHYNHLRDKKLKIKLPSQQLIHQYYQ